jgi:hypothetical protein
MELRPDELCQRCGMVAAVQALVSPQGRLALCRDCWRLVMGRVRRGDCLGCGERPGSLADVKDSPRSGEKVSEVLSLEANRQHGGGIARSRDGCTGGHGSVLGLRCIC